MFDAKLLKYICTAERVFWAGKHPPLSSMTTSTRIFDLNKDFREISVHHGNFSVVFLVEYNLGDFKQWPLILDEALRLLRYGKQGILLVRFAQSSLLSIFAFAAFLRRRKDFVFELMYQDEYSGGMFLYSIYCTREAIIPALKSFEFALITDGKRIDKVSRFIQSIGKVRGINNIDWSIAICGPRNFAQKLAIKSEKIRFIEEPQQHRHKGWITQKKNFIVETSQSENMLIAHDRYEIPADFLEKMLEFGPDFFVIVPAQKETTGLRFPDWVTIGSQWSITPSAMLQYGDYSPHIYINGGVIISKQRKLAETPWNHLLFWNQFEDVELTRILVENGNIPRLARKVQLTVTEVRPGYTASFLQPSFFPATYWEGSACNSLKSPIQLPDVHYPLWFSQERIYPQILGAGWSEPESWGIWSNSSEATLYLPIDEKKRMSDLKCTLTLVGFSPAFSKRQWVSVIFNGKFFGILKMRAKGRNARYTLRFPNELIRNSPVLHLSFRPMFPSSPLVQGLSKDGRLLGVGLVKLDLKSTLWKKRNAKKYFNLG